MYSLRSFPMVYVYNTGMVGCWIPGSLAVPNTTSMAVIRLFARVTNASTNLYMISINKKLYDVHAYCAYLPVMLCIHCRLLDLGFEDFVRVGSVKKIAKPVLQYRQVFGSAGTLAVCVLECYEPFSASV